MFFVLDRVPAKRRGFFGRLWYAARGRPHTVTRVDMPQGYYYVILCSPKPDAKEFSRLRALTARQNGQVLAPGDMLLPKGCGLSRQDSRAFRTRQLIDAALHVLERRGPAIKSAALIDVDGRWQGLAERMLRIVSTVYVVTADQNRYPALNGQLGRELGAELILQPHAECVDGVNAVIAPGGVGGIEGHVCHPMIFAPDTFDALDIAPQNCIVPPRFLPFLPQGIGSDVFAAALCHLPALTHSHEFLPETLCRMGREIALSDLANSHKT